MTKLTGVIVSLMILSTTCFSQKRYIQNAHVGILYPISTNGTLASEYTNRFSFHIFSGLSKNERGLAFSGLVNTIKDSATGLQIAGIFNRIGKQASGVQVAGIMNVAGNADGFQVAGIMNNVQGGWKGFQLAEIINNAQSRQEGYPAKGTANMIRNNNPEIADDSPVIDADNDNSLVTANINNQGVQIAGLVNLSMDVKMQVAGLVNRASNAEMQISGLVNRASDATMQIGGLVNIAKKVSGLQLAGLINIADSSDYPIGIINIIKNGEKGIAVSADENLTTMLAFRSGGRVLYGIVGLGYNLKTSRRLYAFETGIGAHIKVTDHFRLNGEAAVQTLADFHWGEYFKSSIRVLAAWKPAPRLELFAGPAINYIEFTNEKGKDLTDHYLWNKTKYGRFKALAFGAVAGVQINLF